MKTKQNGAKKNYMPMNLIEKQFQKNVLFLEKTVRKEKG